MKTIFINIKFVTILIIMTLFIIPENGICQDEKLVPYLNSKTVKLSDGTRSLQTIITYDGEEDELPLENVNIDYFIINNNEELNLGSVISDKNGLAELIIKADQSLAKDEEGYFQFICRFQHNDKFESEESTISVKDGKIEFTFEMEDDVRVMKFRAFDLSSEEVQPLPDFDLYFYTPRMFSELKIAEGWIEEDGTGFVEFPASIIGDYDGNIPVIAKIEEHDEFGFIEYELLAEGWAIPKEKLSADFDRSLWTPIAPVWMISTLIILLLGVWGHYVYAFIHLMGIKKAAKED